MIKKILSVLGVTAIAAALVLLVAGPASAHNGSLTGTALCQADGTYTITWTGTTTNVPDGDTGVATIKSHTPPSSTLSASTVPDIVGNTTFTFTQSGIPGSTNQANVNLDIAWTGADEYKQNDVTGHVKLDGDCTVPPEPVVVPIVPVTQTASTCFVGVTYTVPEQDARVKYALDAVTGIRPVPGTFPLGAGQSVTIVAHVTAQAIAAGAAPGDYSITITGADALGLANPACHGPLPKPLVVTSDWEDGLYGCGDTSEVQSRTVTTTTYSYDDKYNKVSNTVVVTEHQTVALTEAQIAALDCPIVTPTPTPTPPIVPVKSLAETGSDPSAPFIGGYLLLVAGIGLIATRVALRKRA